MEIRGNGRIRGRSYFRAQKRLSHSPPCCWVFPSEQDCGHTMAVIQPSTVPSFQQQAPQQTIPSYPRHPRSPGALLAVHMGRVLSCLCSFPASFFVLFSHCYWSLPSPHVPLIDLPPCWFVTICACFWLLPVYFKEEKKSSGFILHIHSFLSSCHVNGWMGEWVLGVFFLPPTRRTILLNKILLST